jgi:hypothetical protein
MTMSLLHGILLTSLNNDVIGGMHEATRSFHLIPDRNPGFLRI